MFVLTDNHIELARKAGEVHARAEFDLGVSAGSVLENDPLDEEGIRWMVFHVTGEKLDPESDEAVTLTRAYEDAYFDKWEECLGN